MKKVRVLQIIRDQQEAANNEVDSDNTLRERDMARGKVIALQELYDLIKNQ